MKNKSILLIIASLFITSFLKAQDVEMADTMRSNGKIYVVVAVACIVFVVLAIYMITVDRRLTRLEKEKNK